MVIARPEAVRATPTKKITYGQRLAPDLESRVRMKRHNQADQTGDQKGEVGSYVEKVGNSEELRLSAKSWYAMGCGIGGRSSAAARQSRVNPATSHVRLAITACLRSVSPAHAAKLGKPRENLLEARVFV